jgi:hypothetical protein
MRCQSYEKFCSDNVVLSCQNNGSIKRCNGRDAMAFAAGNKDLGFWWHTLKYPQYIAWFMAGFLFYLVYTSKDKNWVITLVIAMIGAYAAFEATLEYYHGN